MPDTCAKDHALLAALDERVKAFDRIMDSNDRRYTERFQAQQEGIRKAEAELKKRQDDANEWRDAMDDREKRFVPRDTFDARLEGVRNDIASANRQLDRLMGRQQGLSAGWGYLLGAVALTSTVIAIVTTLTT